MEEQVKYLRVKDLMKEKGISREEMASRLGLTPASVSNITSEKTNPTLEQLHAMSVILDIDIRELFLPTKGTVSPGEIDEAKRLIKLGLQKLGD